jgi:hypothetical protein
VSIKRQKDNNNWENITSQVYNFNGDATYDRKDAIFYDKYDKCLENLTSYRIKGPETGFCRGPQSKCKPGSYISLGKTETLNDCAKLCDTKSNCNAFDWMDDNKGCVGWTFPKYENYEPQNNNNSHNKGCWIKIVFLHLKMVIRKMEPHYIIVLQIMVAENIQVRDKVIQVLVILVMVERRLQLKITLKVK